MCYIVTSPDIILAIVSKKWYSTSVHISEERSFTLDRAIVEAIEDSAFEESERVELLLVALGVKPAAMLSLFSSVWRAGNPKESVLETEFDQACSVFEAAGLTYSFEHTIRDVSHADSLGSRFIECILILVGGTKDAHTRRGQLTAKYCRVP